MVSVLRYGVFSAIRNASRSCSFLKVKNPNNVRSLATAVQSTAGNILRNYQEMSIHQCLLLIENKINTKGRLTGFELDCITQAMQNKGSLQSNQVLLLIRCCGSIAMGEKPEIRMAYAEKMWNMVKKSGISLDITHYNAYLKVQMENEQPISPSECLENIKKEGLVPNRVTYQYLLIHCCIKGDLVGATELLEKMKRHNYPLNENVFNALVMGHAMTNDIDGAEGVMDIMKEKEIFITSKTYSMFLCGLAVAGNIEKMRSVMEECSKQNIEIRGSRMMDVVYYLFINGHYDYGEELLKSLGTIQKFSEIITLQYRLLHKKNYEGYLRTLPFISNSDDLVNRMRLAFRYLGNKEDFESILKFKELCDGKGLNVDPLRNILYYSLVKHDSDSEKSLKIVDQLYKSGHSIKETYFAPLLINASKKGDATELLHILTTVSYRYACEVSMELLARCVFDHLDFEEKKMTFLLRALAAQMNPAMILNAFLRSTLRKNDPERIAFVLNKYDVPNKFFDFTLESMARYISNGHNIKSVIRFMTKWIRYKNSSETGKSQTSSGDRNDVQETCDRLAIKVSRLCDSNITEKFLKMAEEENFPISAAVVDLMRQKSTDVSADSPGDGTNEKGFTVDNAKIPEPEGTLDDENTPIGLFSKYRKTGNITEMEKLFNENESLQTHFGFKKIVESLKILNKEDSVKQYLKRYYEKFSQADGLSQNLFLEAEMINNGMLKESMELLSKRFSSTRLRRSSSVIISHIFAPVFERGNENEIKEILSIRNNFGEKLIRIWDVIDNLIQRGAESVAIKIVALLDEQDLNMGDISKSLIPGLFNKKKFELMEELIKYVEDKPTFIQSGSELMFLYACTGKIAKGRELLNSDGLAPLQWMRNVSAIKSPGRLQVLENAIAILRGNESYGRGKIYERLMDCYEMESVSPDKALDLWLQLQEENVQPTPKFLYTLAEILKRSGRDVPFQPPSKKDMVREIYVPQSFPWDIKTAIWSIKGRNSSYNALEKMTTLLLENNLTENHISTILNLNKNMNVEARKVFRSLQYFIGWKRAHADGALVDHLQNFIDNSDGKTPEVKIQELPFQFLLRLLGLFPTKGAIPKKDVIHVILWSHWQNMPEYARFAEMLEPSAREFIKSEEFVERLVTGLELNSFGQKHKGITSFLLAQKVFDEFEHLKKRAEDVLNLKAPVSNDLRFDATESSSDDNFSFQNVFQDQTEEKDIQSNTDLEKPAEKLESRDAIQVLKRESEAGPNV